ncbi:hypothetical protein NHQ30_003081 [Ciborinia camelliae]|nr:hypothetical protein NHQ30_003081 [Ciborinia camelliae]
MPRTYQPVLFLATLAILLMLSLQVQAQAPSNSSIHTNGTFTRQGPTSTRNGTVSITSPTITDSGGFATGTSIINAGENMSPHTAIGGLAVFLGWLLTF